MALVTLYHAGFQEIRQPDIRAGRTNADFGQGFYLSPDEGFSRRWARSARGMDARLNVYSFDADGLAVKTLKRDAAWFDYLFRNRSGDRDSLASYDVIVGPIANDTIYDTMGIITSGLLKPEDALQLLLLGPEYTQVVLKTEKAAARLRFVSAQILPEHEISLCQESVRQEEAAYQKKLSEYLQEITEER